MIIFDLDGTLADCEHRRHFVDPKKNDKFKRRLDATKKECIENSFIKEEYITIDTTRSQCLNQEYIPFKPDWDAFYEACDGDEPIWTTIRILESLHLNTVTMEEESREIQIWSGRSESVRGKTEHWLKYIVGKFTYSKLKMRPIGDFTPDYELKERWLDEALAEGKTVDMVFEDGMQCVQMYRRRGIQCFQVADGDF